MSAPRFIHLADLEAHGAFAYGRVPAIDRATDEIIARHPALDRTAEHSPVGAIARAILRSMNRANAESPVPYRGTHDPRHLRSATGLLPAALRALADEAAIGGRLTLEGLERLHGATGAELFRAWAEAVPEHTSLERLLCSPRLPLDPPRDASRLTREEARSMAPERLAERVRACAIPESLPLLEEVSRPIPAGAFEGVHAVCIQHLLATQVALFGALERRGLEPGNVELIGVPYSTSYVVEHALRLRGYAVDTPEIAAAADLERAMERAIEAALGAALARGGSRPILLLDDGGTGARLIHRRFPEAAYRFRIVEQTTRGITEIAGLESLRAPVIDVARCRLKRHEGMKIGREVVESVDGLLSALGLAGLAGRRALVLGYGRIGSGVAEMLRRSGASVAVHDALPERRRAAREHGHEVPEDRAEGFRERSVIIGASGRRSITPADVPLFAREVVVASASSRTVEIDLGDPSDRRITVVPLLREGAGDRRFTSRVFRFEDRDVVLLRNGFPVNFNGALETGTFESIAPTRALMLLAAAQAITTREPGLHPLGAAALAELRRALQRSRRAPPAP